MDQNGCIVKETENDEKYVYDGLSEDEDMLIPGNIVERDEVKMLKLMDNIKYTKVKSKASCDLSDIQGFTYGPISSRFWLLR
jgi:hypothetical protein